MKVTIRNVLSLAVAFCILSAITVAFARSSPTLDAYSAGCSAEDGGVIAIWADVEGRNPRMDKIGTDTIYLYESIDNKTFYCVKIFEADDYGKRCGFSKRYFLVLVACRHLTCTKTECRKMFLSLIAPLTTIRLNRGKRSNRLPYIFAQGQER